MKLELDFIQKNKTWKFNDLQEGKIPISAKSIFNVKSNLDRKPEKFKATLVACEYE
jgi:hypothetical protein